MIERLSTSIFNAPGHEMRYNRATGYLTCSCPEFKFYGRCPFAMEARGILESEGTKVKFQRPPKPIFLHEIPKFIESMNRVLKEEPPVESSA